MKQQNLKFSDTMIFRKGSLAYHISKKQIYGGSLGYRKMKRPLSNKKAIHVVLKMSDSVYKACRGFRKDTAALNKKLFKLSMRFDLKVYEHAINSNHLHLLCSVKDEKNLGRFLRAFSGSIGLYYKLKYGVIGGLWDGRPFTRLVSWGREFKSVCRYIVKNFKEVVGFIEYVPRANGNYNFIERWMSTA